MRIQRYACNLCRREVASDSTGHPFCASMEFWINDATNRREIKKATPDEADVHICPDCLVLFREFLNGNLMLNMFGEPLTNPG